MDIVKLWSKTVHDAVNRYAKNQTREAKEDFEQDCFVRILEVRDSIDKISEEQGAEAANNYVYGVCHNKVINLILRDGRKCAGLISLDEHPNMPDLVTESHHTFGVTEQDLDEAVKQLPRLEQHVIRNLFFMKTRERDLGASLGKSQRWVRQIKDRAIQQLREILESR